MKNLLGTGLVFFYRISSDSLLDTPILFEMDHNSFASTKPYATLFKLSEFD